MRKLDFVIQTLLLLSALLFLITGLLIDKGLFIMIWLVQFFVGYLKDLMGMIPGVGKQIKDIDINDDTFKGIEAMINSMTMQERRNPDIMNPGRKIRIAKGSGKEIAELNQFLKQFEQMKDMMKMMNKMPVGRMPGMGKR